jgi:hypothetical protein
MDIAKYKQAAKAQKQLLARIGGCMRNVFWYRFRAEVYQHT